MIDKFLPYGQFLVLPALIFTYFCWRFRRRLLNPLIGLPLVLATLSVILSGTYCLWYFHRPYPEPERRELVPGVIFIREIRASPRPLVIHVIEINLDQPGLEFLATPSEPSGKYQVRARTTSQFAKEFSVQIAINASFFYPWHSEGPFDYYPHAGDPCVVCGECMSRGVSYSFPDKGFSPLSISKDNRVSIGGKIDGAYNTVSGREILLTEGNVATDLSDGESLMPCTAVAIDRTSRKMYWIVVDGRQPNHSEGVTVKELAGICKEFGGWSAIALDGGGSSTLVARGADGEPTVLNCPIHGRHPPGRERVVANHLGIVVHQP